VFWVNLDLAVDTDAKKTRPAVVVSNDAQNSVGQRVLAAPVSSKVTRIYSFEAALAVGGTPGKAMLDQVRCLDQSRLRGYMGTASSAEMRAVETALRVAFDLT
jgi:mRNA interferase MazF